MEVLEFWSFGVLEFWSIGGVTKPVFLPNGFCYQTGSVNNQVLLKLGLKQTDCPYVMSCWLSIPAVAEFFFKCLKNADIATFRS